MYSLFVPSRGSFSQYLPLGHINHYFNLICVFSCLLFSGQWTCWHFSSQPPHSSAVILFLLSSMQHLYIWSHNRLWEWWNNSFNLIWVGAQKNSLIYLLHGWYFRQLINPCISNVINPDSLCLPITFNDSKLIGQKNGRKFSVVYYPQIGHSRFVPS